MSTGKLATSPTWTSLGEAERAWVHYQPFLEARGYMLRRRYRPGWVSDIVAFGKSPLDCEDSITCHGEVLDATRLLTGDSVVLKMVETSSAETSIAAFLACTPGAEKHAIQTLEVIPMYDNPQRAFMVMPRMRAVSDPPFFYTVREFIEFVEQVLQGLVFLHSKNIAHRDICTANMVMDASLLIPAGFHFGRTCTSDGVQCLHFDADDANPLVIKSRTRAAPIRYVYIDFGLSVRFRTMEARQLVTGERGRLRKHVPEICETVPYDAFKADVGLVGGMLLGEFLLFYRGLDFIMPFVRKLRRRDPARRPDAATALVLFQRLVSKMDETALEGPLRFCLTQASRKAMLFLHGLGLPKS
ncbi:hypothetical protein B0H17DRAFT_1221072 [Mycena rosella]|uniref:Protein kinase domain-containing protein n=1 Tax=Mycena rosella TaxID=1033263 RepID=A0AAD7B716_MYCRO|nr:hypothetical protein B0H17DRAFT_1221072 [Mycena rosella]